MTKLFALGSVTILVFAYLLEKDNVIKEGDLEDSNMQILHNTKVIFG